MNDQRQHKNVPKHEMGRVDEEHMTVTRSSGVQTWLQFGVEEIGLGLRRARPSFFGRHRDGADTLPFQAQIFEELAHLAGTTPQSGQLKDPFARFGHGAGGLLLEGFADQLAIGGHFTDRAIAFHRRSPSKPPSLNAAT